MGIWFTSDTHYGHRNIVRGVSQWADKSGCRDFDTVDEMNDTIVDQINLCVQETDTLYHIGDWSMGGSRNIAEFRSRLNCRDIHLVYGNHDRAIQTDRYQTRALFSSIQPLMIQRIGGHRIVLCHFPLLVWEDHHRGVWHLHGHSHGHLINPGYYSRKVLDVGVDAHPAFRPYSLGEIADIMERRTVAKIDHH